MEGEMDVASLHHRVQREAESGDLTELEPDFYRALASFLGGLRQQEYDGTAAKVRDAQLGMAGELASLMLNTRLAKARAGAGPDSRLLDEERFILDAHDEEEGRIQAVLAAVGSGRTRHLEALSRRRKGRLVTVRFLEDVGEMTGADMAGYGPFEKEDVAAVPYDNARALISKGAAAEVRLED
ncbi:MAG: hypothetical protein MPJ08_01500 [Nitrosopumilus sp.]|nr:hypothetical protein [Nitrosopumilus sp.]